MEMYPLLNVRQWKMIAIFEEAQEVRDIPFEQSLYITI